MAMGFDEGRLEVAAPELRSLCPESHRSLHVAAPNLSELIWHFHDYDPARHQFAEEAGRHLRRLVTSTNRPEAALMRRFDVVDELNVRVSIAKVRLPCAYAPLHAHSVDRYQYLMFLFLCGFYL